MVHDASLNHAASLACLVPVRALKVLNCRSKLTLRIDKWLFPGLIGRCRILFNVFQALRGLQLRWATRLFLALADDSNALLWASRRMLGCWSDRPLSCITSISVVAVVNRASSACFIILCVWGSARISDACEVRILANSWGFLRRLWWGRSYLMILSLFELHVSGQASTHLLIANVLLRFRFLVDGVMSCTDRSMALIIHGMRMRRVWRLIVVAIRLNSVIHGLLGVKSKHFSVLIIVRSNCLGLMNHYVIWLNMMGNLLRALSGLSLIFVRVF